MAIGEVIFFIYLRIDFKDEELRQTQELGKSKDKSSSLTKQVELLFPFTFLLA